MAFITAETRSELVALSVAMLKQAPSNTLLEELIGISVAGGTLADAADHIAKTAAFKAEYPSFQTAAQYAAEIFDAFTVGGTVTAALRTEVIDLATGLLTSGQYTCNCHSAVHTQDFSQVFQAGMTYPITIHLEGKFNIDTTITKLSIIFRVQDGKTPNSEKDIIQNFKTT